MFERTRRKDFLFALCAVVGLGALNALGMIGRPFWMDEAITTMEFATRPGLLGVYFNYTIPNNHILFTYVVKTCLDLSEWSGFLYGFVLRTPSLLFGCGALALLLVLCARRGGLPAGAALAAFLGVSSTFAIYATAVRGYMLSLCLVAAACLLAARFARRGCFGSGLGYLLISMLCVGTIPTNALALECAALISLRGNPFKRPLRSLWLFLAPPLALAVFYLPILPLFLRSLSLGEGWFSASSALANLYGAFALAFLPLLPFCVWGAVSLWRNAGRYAKSRLLAGLAILLVPVGVELCAGTPPFPRVFLPLWAVWLAILSAPLGRAFKSLGKAAPNLKIPLALGLLLCLQLGTALNFRHEVREALFGDGVHDDLLLPRYAESAFRPDAIAKRVLEISKENPDLGGVFVSFDADHYSVIMHGKFLDVPEGLWLFDSPKRGRIESLPAGKDVLLVCAGKDDLEALEKRFGFKEPELLFDSGVQRLYKVSGAMK